MNKPTLRTVTCLVVVAILTGCAGTAQRDRYFRLSEPTLQRMEAEPAVPAVLEIGPFTARGLLEADRFILKREGAAVITWDEHALWVESPARMVRQALLYSLRQRGLFKQVVSQEQQAAAKYRLIGSLIAFERSGDQTRVLVELDLSLVDVRGRTVVLAKRYRIAEPTADTSTNAAVAAFNQAVARLGVELAEDLRSTLG